jgi:hypothetical protein
LRQPKTVKALQVLVGGIVLVGSIMVVAGLAIYVLWWVSLIAIRPIPMIGRRHRHTEWDRLNRP